MIGRGRERERAEKGEGREVQKKGREEGRGTAN